MVVQLRHIYAFNGVGKHVLDLKNPSARQIPMRRKVPGCKQLELADSEDHAKAHAVLMTLLQLSIPARKSIAHLSTDIGDLPICADVAASEVPRSASQRNYLVVYP